MHPTGADGPELPRDARAFLDAVVAISSDLDLRSVLERVVESACVLTGARRGSLGTLGERGEPADVVTSGTTPPPGTAPAGAPGASSPGLAVPIRIRGTVFGHLHLSDKSGGAGFTEQDGVMVTALARAVSVVIDNARSFNQSERRRRWLETSARIVEDLQPPVRNDDALARIVRGVRSVMSAAAVAVVHRSGPTYVVATVDGPESARVTDLLGPLHEDLRRADADVELLVLPEGERPAVVLVPLRAHLARAGVLVVVLSSGGAALHPEEPELLASFADQASLALDRAQALVDREQLMVLTDRERIARDLHDLVIQRLFATGLQLQAARRLADAGLQMRLDAAVTDLDVTIRDIRSTIFELRRTGSPSLRADVRAVARDYAEVLGFAPVVRTTGPVDTAVTPAQAGHLLAVLREALSNVARHAAAGATVVTVEVSTGPGRLMLAVTDDGGGLPDELDESGLRNVRRRASELGGTLELLPERPRGTRLVWAVPLPGPLPVPGHGQGQGPA